MLSYLLFVCVMWGTAYARRRRARDVRRAAEWAAEREERARHAAAAAAANADGRADPSG